jgi:hypothetical protein
MLYHDRVSISVTFSVAQRNPLFRRGRFVFVEWLPEVLSDYGAVKVAGLCARDCADSGFTPSIAYRTAGTWIGTGSNARGTCGIPRRNSRANY